MDQFNFRRYLVINWSVSLGFFDLKLVIDVSPYNSVVLIDGFVAFERVADSVDAGRWIC